MARQVGPVRRAAAFISSYERCSAHSYSAQTVEEAGRSSLALYNAHGSQRRARIFKTEKTFYSQLLNGLPSYLKSSIVLDL